MSAVLRCRSVLRGVLVAALVVSLCACDSGDDDDAQPVYAVLSAFPAELVPLVERATIEQTMTIEGHVFRVGVLRGVRVVLAMTGIGLINATMTTRALLDNFAVTGVVVSGVAGSPLRIGDVTVPESWQLVDGSTYPAHQPWLALAQELTPPGVVSLDQCTEIPADPSADPVCLGFDPVIAVGGVGQSDDPYTSPFPCQPGGGDIGGCDIPAGIAALAAGSFHAIDSRATVDPAPPIAVDQETAAIGREAAARGLPYIGFRAVSDGEGDPLMLPGFPAQFLTYYRIAARNAAAATMAFLDRLP